LTPLRPIRFISGGRNAQCQNIIPATNGFPIIAQSASADGLHPQHVSESSNTPSGNDDIISAFSKCRIIFSFLGAAALWTLLSSYGIQDSSMLASVSSSACLPETGTGKLEGAQTSLLTRNSVNPLLNDKSL
jgi:hypothetical protein